MVQRSGLKAKTLLVGGVILWLTWMTAPGAGSDDAAPPYSNRLVDSQAPYLLLHAHNPVDWYPWGPEAFEKAKAENKPIFLSVGYSTCFWCHVAERTLYADPEIAALMNRWFVNVKVDREQRPDVDHAYMLARQIISGSGGWPNNVFLTPDLKPFYAGSYFPPERGSTGRPSFSEVLGTLHDAWTNRREEVLATADRVTSALRRVQGAGAPAGADVKLEPEAWKNTAVRTLLRRFDPLEGGFGRARSATKFPQSPALLMLLAEYRRSQDASVGQALTETLDAMAFGGIRDHLAGGFHRYSTDPGWSVPHFEKMLYDNVQLLRAYAEAHALFGDPLYRDTAMQIARYLQHRMMAPDGGFYTAEDAQVDGVEGASYVWTAEQIQEVLGAGEAGALLAVYSLEHVPHSAAARRAAGAPIDEDAGVLRVRLPVDEAVSSSGAADAAALLRSLATSRETLLASRDARRSPLRDEKISVDLNGLAIDGLAAAGRALDEPSLVSLAERAAHRLWRDAFDASSGALRHQIFKGVASGEAFLADYAHLARSLVTLHAVTGDDGWLQRAQRLVDAMLTRFLVDDGRLRVTLAASELPVQPVDRGDVESPSGTSTALEALLAIAAATQDARYRNAASQVLRHLAPAVGQSPEAWPTLLDALMAPQARAVVVAANSPRTVRDGTGAGGLPALKTTADFVSVAVREDAHGPRLLVTLQVTEGYHVNANPATLDFLIPTRVEFSGANPKKITYPPSRKFSPRFTDTVLDVYEGAVGITVEFDATAMTALQGTSAAITAQACNETICLPPSTIRAPIP